jgi:arylsulfatase
MTPRLTSLTVGTLACGALLGWLASSARLGPEARAMDGSPTKSSMGRAGSDPLDCTVLPIPEPQPLAITELDVRNAKAPPRFEVKAPPGVPHELRSEPGGDSDGD